MRVVGRLPHSPPLSQTLTEVKADSGLVVTAVSVSRLAWEWSADCPTRRRRRHTALLHPQTLTDVEADGGVAATAVLVSGLAWEWSADCSTRRRRRHTAQLHPQTLTDVEADDGLPLTALLGRDWRASGRPSAPLAAAVDKLHSCGHRN